MIREGFLEEADLSRISRRKKTISHTSLASGIRQLELRGHLAGWVLAGIEGKLPRICLFGPVLLKLCPSPVRILAPLSLVMP